MSWKLSWRPPTVAMSVCEQGCSSSFMGGHVGLLRCGSLGRMRCDTIRCIGCRFGPQHLGHHLCIGWLAPRCSDQATRRQCCAYEWPHWSSTPNIVGVGPERRVGAACSWRFCAARTRRSVVCRHERALHHCTRRRACASIGLRACTAASLQVLVKLRFGPPARADVVSSFLCVRRRVGAARLNTL